MRRITRPWATWRAVIATRCDTGLSSMREPADRLEQQLTQDPPDQAAVTLYLTDDVFLRSYNWVRWQLGIPQPVEGRGRAAVPQAKHVYTAP